MCLSLTRKKFSIPFVSIKNYFLVKLRHVTGKRFGIENRMLCSILFSIVSTEIGKKVCFRHNKDNFCSSFFILTTNLAKNGYFSENKKSLYSHFSGKTKSFKQKIQQKMVLQEDIPEVTFSTSGNTNSLKPVICSTGYIFIVTQVTAHNT